MDPHINRGLILVEPHGTLIRHRTKKLIIKSKKLNSIVDKPLLLIENKIGLGIIYIDLPKEISIAQFNKLSKYHQITTAEKEKWWQKYKILYAYPISDVLKLKSKFNKLNV